MNLSLCAPIFFSECENILPETCFSDNDKLNWPIQISLLKRVYMDREKLSNANFNEILESFMIMNEGFSLHPYFCSSGIPTVGVGLALFDKNTKKFNPVAVEAFDFIGRSLFNFSDIEKLIQNKCEIISELEAKKMLSFVLDRMKNDIRKILPCFDQLPLNIKISVESLHYNAPVFIKNDFSKELTLFYETQDEKYLKDVLWRICRGFNRGAPYENRPPSSNAWRGLQYRRYREMLMCSNNSIDEKMFRKMHSFFNF